jgi:hypothetical protein
MSQIFEVVIERDCTYLCKVQEIFTLRGAAETEEEAIDKAIKYLNDPKTNEYTTNPKIITKSTDDLNKNIVSKSASIINQIK